MHRRVPPLLALLAAAAFWPATAQAQPTALTVDVTRDGARAADVAVMAFVNEGKPAVPLGRTDRSGRAAIPDHLLNLGKGQRVEVAVEVCRDGRTQVVLIPEGMTAPVDENCDRRRAGVFIWGETAGLTLGLSGTGISFAAAPGAQPAPAAPAVGSGGIWNPGRAHVTGLAAISAISADRGCDDVNRVLAEQPAYTGGCSLDRNSFAGGVTVGGLLLQLGRVGVGLEAGYQSLGEVKQQVVLEAPDFDTDFRSAGFFTPEAMFIAAYGELPFLFMHLIPRVGLARWQASSGFNSVAHSPSGEDRNAHRQDDDGVDPMVGLALAYHLNNYVALMFMADYYWLTAGHGQGRVDERVRVMAFALRWYPWLMLSRGRQ